MSNGIDFDAMPAEVANMTLVSASDWRTDRVNALFYGGIGSGKTHIAVGFPKPVLIDTGENGALTVKKMLVEKELKNDLPVITTTNFITIMSIVGNPVGVLGGMFKGSKWEGYENEMETLVFDTVSTMEGWCMSAILKDKGKSEGEDSIQEVNALKRRMLAFFRGAWNLKYNTVMLAHDMDARPEVRGNNGAVMMKEKKAGILLTGDLAVRGPALTDFFLHLVTEPAIMGNPPRFVAHSEEHNGFPARTKLQGYLDAEIENLNYTHLREALDRVERDAENE